MTKIHITEFLLPRIAEDESMLSEGVYSEARLYAQTEPERWRAECEAKRRIVEEHAYVVNTLMTGPVCVSCWTENNGADGPGIWPCRTLRLLALPYKNHPDYQEEWEL